MAYSQMRHAAKKGANSVTRINLWSLPRCASTSLMYAFAQRADCKVFDEPLYAFYLDRNPHLDRPYKEELLATGIRDGDAVVRDIILSDEDVEEKPVRFFKHIASQFTPCLDRGFLSESDHAILLRHPYRVVASYFRTHGSVEVDDTGLPRLLELRKELNASGYEPPVLDNYDLLSKPETALQALCENFHLPYDEGMTSWEKGGIPEDGVWASHWYKGTHESTSFRRDKANSTLPTTRVSTAEEAKVLEGLPEHVCKTAQECLPLYEEAKVLEGLPEHVCKTA
eukprot:CAMPEP_0203744548 /NCGR_PEP_ID=MMETSP0098-20131031/580_1 /ASSEMBLY_ACC=CAM_ASM_000208 /TAXON_ID=96639 /ORGANISM=" , Strain NY0313808BC1" /LENGTH=282 /DNA_ID=CAMNT_0050632093 /DNA_START=168 /DNA_END=1012 /DNA_ORIENTATION=+